FALIGVKRGSGHKMVQGLHYELLLALHLRYPALEAILTWEEIAGLVKCDAPTRRDSMRRVLNDLEELGLIERLDGPGGLVILRPPLGEQLALPLAPADEPAAQCAL